jgi:hypothetical protein
MIIRDVSKNHRPYMKSTSPNSELPARESLTVARGSIAVALMKSIGLGVASIMVMLGPFVVPNDPRTQPPRDGWLYRTFGDNWIYILLVIGTIIFLIALWWTIQNLRRWFDLERIRKQHNAE